MSRRVRSSSGLQWPCAHASTGEPVRTTGLDAAMSAVMLLPIAFMSLHARRRTARGGSGIASAWPVVSSFLRGRASPTRTLLTRSANASWPGSTGASELLLPPMRSGCPEK